MMTAASFTVSEVVVVDHAVQERRILLRSLRPGTLKLVLDPGRNGLEQIASALAGLHSLSALHIVSHGCEGSLHLGSAFIDASNLEAHCGSLATIAAALGPDADMLLYGCDVASTNAGRAFVDNIARLTGANVAAAESKTGASALGGDWDLQYRCGEISARVFASTEVRRAYPHVLAAPNPFPVSSLNGDNGFKLTGVAQYDSAGQSVAAAGDVNGDGFDDFVIGAFRASPKGLVESGATYVVFGGPDGFDASAPLSILDGSNGFRISGVATGDRSGLSVSGADINGDGLSDVIIGANLADANGVDSGAAYVIFGKSSPFASNIDLSSLTGSNGFVVPGSATLQLAGGAVSSAGDVNGDGFDDLLVAASQAGTGYSGAAYVIFGHAAGFPASMSLQSIDGSNGFKMVGAAGNQIGNVLAAAGDVNGDGYDDIVVGGSSHLNGTNSGIAYVLFGKRTGFAPTVDLSTLAAGEGFRLLGESAYDSLGNSVGPAGDVNGDGVDDIVVGASRADANGSDAGAVYVIYGRTTFIPEEVTVPSYGSKIVGAGINAQAGSAVSFAGDVNADGYDDLLIDAQPDSYVVFGRSGGLGATFNLSTIDGDNGFRIAAPATRVSSAGDLDGDGFDDLVLGAPGDDPNGPLSGSVSVIYGDDFTQSVSRLGTDEDDTLTGTASADTFVADAGNDTILTGAGADVVYAGSGDDEIRIAGGDFKRIDGGPGTDTIALAGSGLFLDLRTIANTRIADVEVIDLTGTGNNSLALDTRDLFALTRSDRVRIDGDAGDYVSHLSFWIAGGHATNGDQSYQLYTRGPTTIEIDTDVLVRFAGGNIDEVDPALGVSLWGQTAGDNTGYSVSGVGDVNGDGFEDIVIGASASGTNGSYAGASYVVFGKATGFDPNILLSGLDGTAGFRILGADAGDNAGLSVSGAGDVNGDGFDDVLVGASGLDPFGPPAGGAYVVLGKSSAFAASIELADLDGSDGFRLLGEFVGELTGTSSAGVGDVNGDGFDDFVIGGPRVDSGGTNTGRAYVVFGTNTFPASTELDSLDGTTGFALDGAADRSYTGQSVAGAGDVNGDGYADIIVGAPGVDASGADAGAAYVVFGKAGGFAASLSLPALDGSNGFRLLGAAATDSAGRAVGGAGDVNGDGFDDIVVSAYRAPNGAGSGVAYVVFGHAGAFDASLSLADIDGSNGFALTGSRLAGYSVASGGDINGDGYDDVLVGEPRGGVNGSGSGIAYVVYGKADGFAPNVDLTALDGRDGFRLFGTEAGDDFGRSVAFAGDMDGDGFDDIVLGARNGDGEAPDSGTAHVLFGGNFTDAVARAGTADADNLTGTSAAERILGGRGNDVINGAGSDDWLVGGIGNDTLLGGEGDDTLEGGEGTDALDGGPGDDTYLIDDALDTISDAAGTDTVRTGLSYVLPGGIENLTLLGAADIDATGNAAANVLTGNAGNNVLDGAGGADTLNGGAGDDTYILRSLDITLSDESGFDEIVTFLESSTLPADFEILRIGSGFDIVVGYGNSVDNYLYANGLGQELHGFAGNDRLFGNLAADRLEGGPGIDTLYGGDSADILLGQEDDDRLEGEAGDDIMFAGAGADVVLGGAGADRAWGENGDDLIFGGTDNDSLLGEFGNDRIWGEDGDDDLFGGVGDDQLIGEAGNDRLFGDVGADDLFGGDGLDLLLGEDDDDRLFGGNDADDLFGQAGADLLLGENGNDRLWGGSGADLLFGQAGDDLLQGEEDNDRLFGGDGNDLLFGQAGDDELQGEADNDRLFGGAGVDRLFGQAGDDELQGEEDADFLYGGDGADVLWGGAGNDVLYGEDGADRFAFVQGDGADIVADFQDGIDLLDLRFYAGATIGNTTIAAQGAHTLVTFTGGESALLVGIDSANVTVNDLLF